MYKYRIGTGWYALGSRKRVTLGGYFRGLVREADTRTESWMKPESTQQILKSSLGNSVRKGTEAGRAWHVPGIARRPAWSRRWEETSKREQGMEQGSRTGPQGKNGFYVVKGLFKKK